MKILKDVLLIIAIIFFSYLLFLFSIKYVPKGKTVNYLNPLGLTISTFYIKNGIVKLGILNPTNNTYEIYLNYVILKTEYGSMCSVYPSYVIGLKPYEEYLITFDLSVDPECKKVYVQTKRKGVKVIAIVSYEEAGGHRMGTLKAYTIT